MEEVTCSQVPDSTQGQVPSGETRRRSQLITED
jgi:hypothetical protein